MADAVEPEGSPAEAAGSEDERARRARDVEELRERGVDPYPVTFHRDRTLAELREEFGDLEPDVETEVEVTVAGRIVLLRRQGKLTFATIRDRDDSVQLFVSREVVGEDGQADFNRLDRGDWVGASGTVMTTRKGELSVKVQRFQLLAKALRPLPDKWHGLADVDTRFRQRYVDLIVNEDARRIFAIRSRAVTEIRRFLGERGYVEVEGPVLTAEAGGAAARPFVTHHNALDLELRLRIALELHLKRLIVGGLDKVFEIGRVFRNEGIDTRHNPEFTMLELYEAFADYHDMMSLTEELVAATARATLGGTVVEVGEGKVDLAPPWPRVPMLDLIEQHAGVRVHPSQPVEELRAVLERLGVPVEPHWGPGRLIMELYDDVVEPKLVDPIFVLDYPREVSPLARTHRDDPALVERFEGVVAGRELANAFSELNDPVDQRARFEAQARLRAAGDEEAEGIDEDYLRALEYGMPPTGGLGIGIDRLVMLLAGVSSIREVVLFPTLRPEAD